MLFRRPWDFLLDSDPAGANDSTRSAQRKPRMDAFVTEVVVVLDKAYEERLKEAVAMLQAAGLEVSNANDDNNVVEGCIEASKVAALEKLDAVDYVRKVFTYEANYPPGDPRDVDKV